MLFIKILKSTTYDRCHQDRKFQRFPDILFLIQVKTLFFLKESNLASANQSIDRFFDDVLT